MILWQESLLFYLLPGAIDVATVNPTFGSLSCCCDQLSGIRTLQCLAIYRTRAATALHSASGFQIIALIHCNKALLLLHCILTPGIKLGLWPAIAGATQLLLWTPSPVCCQYATLMSHHWATLLFFCDCPLGPKLQLLPPITGLHYCNTMPCP